MELLELKRLLIGDQSPWFLVEVGVRVLVMYGWAVLMLRWLGKRGRRQMTPLEYVVIIALGSAAGDPMFYLDVPLLYGMGVIALLVLATRGLASLKQEVRWLENFLNSKPSVLMEDGKILEENMNQQDFSQEELETSLREVGVRYLEEVEVAILEVSGKVSVFKKKRFVGKTDLVEKLVKEMKKM